MKRQWNILNRLSRDNRGSGIVVVLVSMTCIALMGASLLFMSYTAVRMRATERQASRDFYSAETAMDEIRAGAQSMASEAIGKAYKTVLTTYSEGGNMNQAFANAFVDELKKTHLISSDERRYDPSVLFSYVSNQPGIVVSGTGTVDNSNPNELVLKGIKVTYTANNEYVTTISTDISIGMPLFSYVTSGSSLTGLPEHALIADDTLVHTVGNSSIDITGSAYVGSMDLRTEDSQLTISDGTLVCANDAVISGGNAAGRLVTADDVKLWAGRIEVTGGGTIKLEGETRVLDDLELAGGNSSATLKGSYYGFGDGTIPDDVNEANPITANYSSAILVNGLGCTLDLSGLDHLMLAGRSYISDSLYGTTVSGANTVGMLESVAVRSNQQAYLFDTTDFMVDFDKDSSTAPVAVDRNPFLATVEGLLDKENGSYKWITLTEEAQQRANRYGYKLAARQYEVYGEQVIYCFMEFTDLNKANAYFEERFASKSSSHLDSYLANGTKLNASDSSTYGYSLGGSGTVADPYLLSQPTRTQFSPWGMRNTFSQMKKTLIDANANVRPGTTPYTYIVDTEKVNALAENEQKYFTFNGKDVGVVVNNKVGDVDTPYNITSSNSTKDLCLVVASGSVKVSREYHGLIISGEDIILNGSMLIKHDDDAVVNAIKYAIDSADTNTETKDLIDYFLRGITDGDDDEGEGENVPSSEDGWNLDDLVTYKNWTKN